MVIMVYIKLYDLGEVAMRGWKALWCVIALLFVAVSQSEASTDDLWRSDFWLKLCNSDKPSERLACLSLIHGYGEGTAGAIGLSTLNLKTTGHLSDEEYKRFNDWFHRQTLGCNRDKVSLGQRMKIWVKYLEEHPEKHHERPLVTLAISQREALCK